MIPNFLPLFKFPWPCLHALYFSSGSVRIDFFFFLSYELTPPNLSSKMRCAYWCSFGSVYLSSKFQFIRRVTMFSSFWGVFFNVFFCIEVALFPFTDIVILKPIGETLFLFCMYSCVTNWCEHFFTFLYFIRWKGYPLFQSTRPVGFSQLEESRLLDHETGPVILRLEENVLPPTPTLSETLGFFL